MKKNYSAPKMVQVKMEAEMPVMAGSASSISNLSVKSIKVTTPSDDDVNNGSILRFF